MTDTLLHAVAIPNDSQTSTSAQRGKKLAKKGVLQSDVPSTETVSAQPGQRRISGQIRGQFAVIHARMIEELLSSSIAVVPYAGDDERTDIDGYYAPEDVQRSPLDPREDRLQQFDGILTPKGTRRSHWRAIRTNTQPVNNPFGSAATPEVGLTIRARKVRWFNDTDGTLESASPVRTVDGEHDQLNIYDATEPSFDSPTLIYDIAYTDEYPTDCTVWDTFGRPKVYRESDDGDTVGSAAVGTATVSSDAVVVESQWQRVYVTDHEWRGDIVLETDRLRLTIEQPEDVLHAYRYSPSDDQYTTVQLGQSDWRLFDIDLTGIGLASIDAQLEFENEASGERYNLNLSLIRGLDNGIWTVPSNEGGAPQGLIDRLDPIAAATDSAVVPEQDVLKRTEVDR